MDSYCVLVTPFYNSSGDEALLFYQRVGGIRCRMKLSCDLASLPRGINDADAFSSLLLYNTIAKGETVHTKDTKTPF